jgi:hypothetical protein
MVVFGIRNVEPATVSVGYILKSSLQISWSLAVVYKIYAIVIEGFCVGVAIMIAFQMCDN